MDLEGKYAINKQKIEIIEKNKLKDLNKKGN